MMERFVRVTLRGDDEELSQAILPYSAIKGIFSTEDGVILMYDNPATKQVEQMTIQETLYSLADKLDCN